MFFLQGVARFLFVPMAEAVMFAMIWSFILSRTLVPTMAKYLLQPHRAPCRGRRAAAVAQSAGAVSARLRGALRAGPRRLPRSAVAGDARTAGFRDRLPRLRRGFVPAGAVSRPEFLSLGRRRIDPDACPHPGRHPRRGKRQPVRRRAEGDPQDHSAGGNRDAGRQYRHADQRHQHDLQQHRRDRPAGRRYPDQAEGGPPADR